MEKNQEFIVTIEDMNDDGAATPITSAVFLRNTRASIPASTGNGWRMGQGRFKDRFRTG